MKKALGAIAIVAVVWFIPVTARAIEALIRSAVVSLGTAQDLSDVNIAIVKGIFAVLLFILLVVIFKRPTKTS